MGWRTAQLSVLRSYGTWGKECEIFVHSTRPVVPVQTVREIQFRLRFLRPCAGLFCPLAWTGREIQQRGYY